MVDNGHVADREGMARAVDDLDVVPGCERAFLDDPHVGARAPGGGEPDRELRVVHPRAELPAGRPRPGDLVATVEPIDLLADDGRADVEALEGVRSSPKVASSTGRARLFGHRPILRVRVDGLVGAAVEVAVGLVVAGDVHAGNLDAALDQLLQMDVVARRPSHSISRGSPTLTETTRPGAPPRYPPTSPCRRPPLHHLLEGGLGPLHRVPVPPLMLGLAVQWYLKRSLPSRRPCRS